MRILIAGSTYAPAMNGQAVFTTNLAEGLVKRGHKVLMVLDSHHGNASQTLVNGVQVIELRSVSLNILHSGIYFSPFPGSEVRRLLETFQPEVIHVQDHYPICRAVVHRARKRKMRIVGSNHFVPDNLAPYVPGLSKIKPVFNWVLWQWMLDVYKHVDVISAQSNAAVKLIQLQGLKMPILPISCGINLHLFRPNPMVNQQMFRERFGIDLHKITFLFLGRIDGEKRVDLLIHAMQQLYRDDIQLVIAGNGKVEDPLHRRVTDLHLHQKVRFTGFISPEDVPGLMNSVDVFVMPSEAELLSISTLEAMACGRPVLLSNALALPELVRDGENGYLFKPGDVRDLVYHMNLLADHPERWETMGRISREIALTHSLEDTIQKFEMIYSQLAVQGSVTDVKLRVNSPA
jgi:1,2-diacylglycerol 3-alpha-glucosyltransferase